MSLRSRIRGSLTYAIAVIGGFLAAYLIVAFVVFPSGVVPRDIKVPNVTGLQFTNAMSRLTEMGLHGVRGEERNHDAAPRETVLEQDPAAGSKDVEGATVTLAVSIGPKRARVPQLVGLSQTDAQRLLDSAGFDVGDIGERTSTEPAGQVLESHPVPGTETPVPATVALVVSAGGGLVTVPDVVGRTVGDARQILEHIGLVIDNVTTAGGGTVTSVSDTVTAQVPGAGAQVTTGSHLVLQAGGGHT